MVDILKKGHAEKMFRTRRRVQQYLTII